MSNAKILIIKTGLIETLTFPDGSSYESAIRKKTVPMVKVHTLGAEGNDVGLKAHHGGVDKALFFMSDVSFDALNALLGENFDFHGSAIYGENFVVSGLHEDNVCIGDRYKIGTTLLEVSQPTTFRDWGLVFIYGAVMQCVAWGMIAYTIPYLSLGLTGLLLLSEPVVALVIDYFGLDKPINHWQWAGAVLTLVAIYLGSQKKLLKTKKCGKFHRTLSSH